MPMTPSQIAKTQAIADNLAGSAALRAKARHAVDHDHPSCPDCAAWRGRPDIFQKGVVDEQSRLDTTLDQASGDPGRRDRL